MFYGVPELESFREVVVRDGVDVAVRFLNLRVPHRYTAIYQLRVGVLKNVALYDKLGEHDASALAEVPLVDSFCQFTLRDGEFATRDSRHDARLDGHPAQGTMLAYHAVPLLGNRGDLFGTLCHFDWVEQALSDDEFRYLQRVARVLSPHMLSAYD